MSDSTAEFRALSPGPWKDPSGVRNRASNTVKDTFTKTRIKELRAAWTASHDEPAFVSGFWEGIHTRLSYDAITWGYKPFAPSDTVGEAQHRGAARTGLREASVAAPDALVDEFRLRRELIGRVRDIDRDAGEFLAVLNDRGADEESELTARFPLKLLSDTEQRRLEVGAAFSLVTGYRHVGTTSGETLKASLETRILLRRSPPLSAALVDAARERARQLRSR